MESDSCLNDIKIWKLLCNTDNLDDDILVEEILHIPYNQSYITQKIVSQYMKTGKLSYDDRKKLVAHYVLYWMGEE